MIFSGPTSSLSFLLLIKNDCHPSRGGHYCDRGDGYGSDAPSNGNPEMLDSKDCADRSREKNRAERHQNEERGCEG